MADVTVYTAQESGDIKFGDGLGMTTLRIINHRVSCSPAIADLLVRRGLASRTANPAWTPRIFTSRKASKEEEKET